MRIKLQISANKELVPFNYQHLLTGTIHKRLGNNQDHGAVSLYSFSNLTGSKISNLISMMVQNLVSVPGLLFSLAILSQSVDYAIAETLFSI